MGQKSEVANPNEPDGQHMQEEAAQELMHTQSHETLFVAVPRIPPTKRHMMIFQRRQAVTGYGHAMRVSAQVVHHMLSPAKRTFRVHDPVFVVNGPHQLSKSMRIFERSQNAFQHQPTVGVQLTKTLNELAPKHPCQYFHRQKEPRR